MSSQKTSNNDSCRDLNGRRLSTIKEAKKLAEYLEGEPARKRATAEAQKAKLEALERKLGIDGQSTNRGNATGPPNSNGAEPQTLVGKKHRFDDTEYLEQGREIVDNVKSAVTLGLLRKKKKAKVSHAQDEAPAPLAAPTSSSPASTSKSENVAMPTIVASTSPAGLALASVGA